MNQDVILSSPHDHSSALFEGKRIPLNQGNDESFFASSNELKELSELTNFQGLLSDGNAMNSNLENSTGNENYPFLKRPLINSLQTGDSLRKVDSFSRWIAKELAEADDLNMQSSGGISWSIMGSEYDSNMTAQLQGDVDTLSLSPSISQDQLFSIINISPNWAYSNMETKVLELISDLYFSSVLSVYCLRDSCLYHIHKLKSILLHLALLNHYFFLFNVETIMLIITFLFCCFIKGPSHWNVSQERRRIIKI